MFEVTLRNENHLDIKLSGKLDSDEMKIALDKLENLSKNIVHGTMLYDVIDFKIPTLSAIMVEFSRLPAMFKLINKFDQAAVLSDKTWLKTISEIEGSFIPGLDIKAFDRDQKLEAENWLSIKAE